MKDKEYHLYLCRVFALFDTRFCYTVDEVETAIKCGDSEIYTFQVVTCTTDLFSNGYRIFVHVTPEDSFEITLGNCERTNREIRMGHCLWKMILSGEFDSTSQGDETEIDYHLFELGIDGSSQSLDYSEYSGEWIRSNPETDTEECSCCGYNIISDELRTPFCPWCGRMMLNYNDGGADCGYQTKQD